VTDQPRTALTGKPMRTPWPPADMPEGHKPVYLRWDDDTDQLFMRNGGASDDPALVYFVPERTCDLWFGALLTWEATKSQAFWDHVAPRLDQQEQNESPSGQDQTPAEPVHDEFWRHIDWFLWGSGMRDTAREPLADAMLTGLTPEYRQQVNDHLAWWRTQNEFTGRDTYETQKAEIDRLRGLLTEAGINPDEEQQ
jgi:hypothetical protein